MEEDKSALSRPLAKGQSELILKIFAILFLGIPLLLGVAWAGDGRPESWISGLIGLLILVGVIMTSGSNGFYVVGDGNGEADGDAGEPEEKGRP